MESVIEQIDRIAELKQGWDSYGADPVQQPIIDYVRALIKKWTSDNFNLPTRIVPGVCGTLSMEWQLPGLYLDAEVTAPGKLEWMVEWPNGKIEHWDVEYPLIEVPSNA